MMQKTTYQAARTVAQAIENHFTLHIAAARQRGGQALAMPPQRLAIEAMIDVSFWASLLREEGRSPKISLAFLPPEQAQQPMLFSLRLPLTPGAITKLAPAVERPGIHLGVWHEGEELYIWGATRKIPSFCFVLEVVEPGLLVVKHRRMAGYGKFANVVVLKGEEIKLLDGNATTLTDSSDLLTSVLDFASTSFDTANILIELAVSMRNHGRGGSLLVVPHGSDAWQQSIIRPIPYAVEPAYSGLKDVIQLTEQVQDKGPWRSRLQQSIDGIAGLTAVDGATLISNQYELLAFGAKIGRPDKNAPVAQVCIKEPVVGGINTVMHPAQLGGTRHLSAAQFVYDQHDALALVASQDGRFTVFGWSQAQEIVQAQRIDALLL
ncbi:putative sensor domain DACNV-containing protein [Pontibacter sp. CAU 1760]